MSAKSEHSIRVRNARQQPVELHLPERMVVLNPAGAAELGSDELSCPQIQVLLRHRLIQVESSAPAIAELPAERPAEEFRPGSVVPMPLAEESTPSDEPGSTEPADPEVPMASRRRSPRGTSKVEGDK